METLDVKCPWCSAILRIKQTLGMEGKNITCPNCKRTSPFIQFKTLVSKLEESVTCFPSTNNATLNCEDLKIGRLVNLKTGVVFQLRPGKNIIGRKASVSSANFQIPTGENKRMSREHLVIEVKKSPSYGYTHLVSLFKEKINQTYVNQTELLFGDTIILQDGDVIKLPDLDIRFELPDEEATQI